MFNYKIGDTGAKVDLNTEGCEVLPEGLQDLDQPVCAQMWLAGHQNVLQCTSEQRRITSLSICGQAPAKPYIYV